MTGHAPDDTVAWIRVGDVTTLGVYRAGAWWTDVDVDDTGISGHRHDDHVEVLRILTMSTVPDRRPDDASNSWQHRLHSHIQDRRRHLGLTLSGIQAAGGPSGRWVQNLLHLEGPPTDRMRLPMRRLDGALEWPVGTAWRIANGADQ